MTRGWFPMDGVLCVWIFVFRMTLKNVLWSLDPEKGLGGSILAGLLGEKIPRQQM